MRTGGMNRIEKQESAYGENGHFRVHFGAQALFVAVMVWFLIAGSPASASAGCPPRAQVKQTLERLIRNKVEVIAVQESALSGICEVAFRQRSRVQMAYMDVDGTHVFFGKIFESQTGRNLTDESLAAVNRMTDRDVEELPALTAFSIGSDGAQVLYYVTDPQCPYCKKGEEDLKKMAAEGKIQVHFLLLPLEFHKGAKEQCISVICDQKGLEAFEKGYRSKNQCEEGRMLVESTVDFLKKKGIRSTPTYIFSDGRIHSGVLRPDILERWLKRDGKVVNGRELKAEKGSRD